MVFKNEPRSYKMLGPTHLWSGLRLKRHFYSSNTSFFDNTQFLYQYIESIIYFLLLRF